MLFACVKTYPVFGRLVPKTISQRHIFSLSTGLDFPRSERPFRLLHLSQKTRAIHHNAFSGGRPRGERSLEKMSSFPPLFLPLSVFLSVSLSPSLSLSLSPHSLFPLFAPAVYFCICLGEGVVRADIATALSGHLSGHLALHTG